ncbi:MAG: type I-E CRISPR-associated endoribonuclease Cas2e [Polyangiales bacterium]
MTLIVTRNAPERTRGFLASCMCEVAPGVYTSPRMSKAVRERVVHVLESWYRLGSSEGYVVTWPDGSLPGGQAFLCLGTPTTELYDHDGVFLTRHRHSSGSDVPF